MRIFINLHAAFLIHGDCKPDNFLLISNRLRQHDVLGDLQAQWVPDVIGIDLGCSIDLKGINTAEPLNRSCICHASTENGGLTHLLDWRGIAAVLYFCLNGRHVPTHRTNDRLTFISTLKR
eukprot:Filipodium_phascolosomae@DN2384_c0_g1_i1.p2